MTRVIVCGGRHFADRDLVFRTLDDLAPTEVAHGAARGADSLANEWCLSRGVKVKAYFADWSTDGKAAGPIRNERMLDDFVPDLVVAFPGGRGTADMVARAERAGVRVMRIGSEAKP